MTRRAFSLIELILVVAVLAVVGTMAATQVVNARQAAAFAKLSADVEMINRSISLYVLQGGTFAEGDSAETVIRKMQKRRTAADADTAMGLTQNVLDARIVPIPQTADQSGTTEARAVLTWDAARQIPQFQVVTTGGAGIREFALDEQAGAASAVTAAANLEERSDFLLASRKSASVAKWVWDYEESPLTDVAAGGTPSIGGGTSAPVDPFSTAPPAGGVSKSLVQPLLTGPATVTYAQAGGVMANGSQTTPVSIAFAVTGVPAGMESKVALSVSGVTATDTGVLAKTAPLNVAAFGSGSSLTATAAVEPVGDGAEHFVFGNAKSAEVTIQKTPLPVPAVMVNIPDKVATIAAGSSSQLPAGGSDIRYTTNGATPTLSSSVYSSPIALSGTGTVAAATFPKTGFEKWFDASGVDSEGYAIGSSGSGLPSGVLLQALELQNNVVINGSVTLTQPRYDLKFAGNFKIKGNLYVVGTPAVFFGWEAPQRRWSVANDGLFSSRILGKQFDEGTGAAVIPQDPNWAPSPRVVDKGGQYEPSYETDRNYYIMFWSNSNDVVEGKIFRQIVPVTLPGVDAPPPRDRAAVRAAEFKNQGVYPPEPINSFDYTDVVIQMNKTVSLEAGNYRSLTGGVSGATFVLGDASNPENVQHYSFESINLSGGASIKLVGKVVITVNVSNGSNVVVHNTSKFGVSDVPGWSADWLQLQLFSNKSASETSEHFLLTGSSQFFGQIVAPKGLVTLHNDSTFQGSVTAHKLKMTGNGSGNIQFTLPPL